MSHDGSTRTSSSIDGALVGVDVGGTHTDVEVLVDKRSVRGKALTTYDDFSVGVLEAIEQAARELGVGLRELLESTQLLVNGTTVVTNTLTELRGSRVGVLVTAGFRDTFRFAGGPRLPAFDDHLQRNVPDLVDRAMIRDVTGRIDYSGRELIPLNEEEIRAAVRRLVGEQNAEAIAVCLLNSHASSAHEVRVEEIVAELFPSVFVTSSHRIVPLLGENRRWTTAVLNCFVQGRARDYLDSLSHRLAASGLRRPPTFFQGLGGAISRARAERTPLALLGSGPAGGAVGANELGRKLGRQHLLLGDMGGTSFDTGVIWDNELRINDSVRIGLFQTGISVVDVVSVGAGGGSIVWVSERDVPQVGPRSAGSTPGPACYGRGGTEPTVTDVMVAMGVLDPDNYLGGRYVLRADFACEALERVICRPFGWSVDRAGGALHDLVVATMANAVREVSIGKGHDPRDFTFVAYGGCLPMFAVQIAAAIGIDEVLVPRNSSVFCAQGLLSSDYRLRLDKPVGARIDAGSGLPQLNATVEALRAEAFEAMLAEGFAIGDIAVSCAAALRFEGQMHELSIPLLIRPFDADEVQLLTDRFVEQYERVYGPGTAWRDSPVTVVSCSVTATGRMPHRPLTPELRPPRTAEAMCIGPRSVYLPSEGVRTNLDVYDHALVVPGTELKGPVIIEASDTTILVPPGARARADEFLNYWLSVETP